MVLQAATKAMCIALVLSEVGSCGSHERLMRDLVRCDLGCAMWQWDTRNGTIGRVGIVIAASLLVT